MLKHWTNEQLKELTLLYPKYSREQLQQHFPNKSYNQIHHAARYLHIKKTLQYLQDMRAKGLSQTKNVWTQSELQLVRTLYPVATREEIMRKLPYRAWRSIAVKARQNNAHRNWTVRAEYEHLDTLPDHAKSWLAAAIDCEGTIGIARHGTDYMCYISMSNTNRDLIYRFRDLLAIKHDLYINERVKEKHHKHVFMLSVSRMPLLSTLLKAIKSYLVAKPEQANVVLKFLEIQQAKPYKEKAIYTEEQLTLYNKCLALNKRGK